MCQRMCLTKRLLDLQPGGDILPTAVWTTADESRLLDVEIYPRYLDWNDCKRMSTSDVCGWHQDKPFGTPDVDPLLWKTQ
jgi:hypothetical protein